MTTDDQKHSRRHNSDDESQKSPKRHKHRHHHHHRRHKHHSKNNQINKIENESHTTNSPVIVSNADCQPDYDMEEGEIVDFDIGIDTDMNFDSSHHVTEEVSIHVDDQNRKVGSGMMVLGEGNSDDGFKDNATAVRKGENSLDTEICDAVELQRNPSVGNHVNGDFFGDENNKYLKSLRDEVVVKGKGYIDDKKESRGHSKSSLSDTPSERRNSIEYSPQERYSEKYCSTNRSRSRDHGRERPRSRDHGRERSRSQSIIQDVSLLHSHHGDAAYDSDGKQTIDSNDETISKHHRDHRHGSRDSLRDEKRDRSSNYYSKHNVGVDDRISEASECNRDRSWEERDRERDRGKERERQRDKDMDRVRERERSDRERERRDRKRGRDRMGEGERDSRHRKYHDVNNTGDRNRHNEHRHQRSDDKEYRARPRKNEKEQIYSYGTDHSERDAQKLHRDEVEQEDHQETVVMHIAEQEEEDLSRIKEESRRRRQAILEKYKTQQSQQKHELKSEETVKDSTKQPSVLIADAHGSQNESEDMFLNDTSFSVGKSPEQTGPLALKISGPGTLGEGTPKSERSGDMFCDDIFGDSPAGVRKQGKGDGLKIERSGLHDNWDDAEGYYSYRFGEVLDGRYEVIAAHGKGVFSNVVCARDLKAGSDDPEEVAIKIIRSNDTMYKAGLEELVILKKLAGADPEDRRHCVRFLSSFKYRNHLCLVFESLHMNLREVLKKFGRNIGLKLTAVRVYAKQLFIALKHMKNCGVLHSDIKPDNMLVNEAKNVLKLSDFGSAMFAGKNEITPYLVSRFYRAPEIILGLSYDHPMDIWSVGCCLYELYTGKVLFPGPSNNDMLRLHMELKGPFPKKMLRKGAFTEQHFDQVLNFFATEEDPVSKKAIKRLILNIKPKDISAILLGSAGEDPKMLANFKDILEKIFVLDPDKRITVSQALSHPFITGK